MDNWLDCSRFRRNEWGSIRFRRRYGERPLQRLVYGSGLFQSPPANARLHPNRARSDRGPRWLTSFI